MNQKSKARKKAKTEKEVEEATTRADSICHICSEGSHFANDCKKLGLGKGKGGGKGKEQKGNGKSKRPTNLDTRGYAKRQVARVTMAWRAGLGGARA